MSSAYGTTMLSPSLPPAICKTTRMVPSFPVALWVSASAAIASSAKKVFSRKTGNVQEAAAPNIDVRRNCRRVCIVCFIDRLGELELRRAHHKMQQTAHGFVASIGVSRLEVVNKSVCFFRGCLGLKEAIAPVRHKFLRLFRCSAGINLEQSI